MSTINFNDGIFAAEALQAFVANSPALSLFSHSYNAEAAQKGSAIYVPRVDALTATTFSYTDNAGFPYEQAGGRSIRSRSTLISNLLSQLISAICKRQTAQPHRSPISHASKGRFSPKKHGKVSRHCLPQLISAPLSQTSVLPAYGYTVGVSIRTAMVKRDVPVEDLNFIVNADVNNSFLRDSVIYQNQVFNGNVAQTGIVPRIAGIPVTETNIMPTTASLVGIVAHPDSVALACRYLEPINPGSYISAMRVVDDTSGIVLGYRRHYSPGRGKMFANFEVLFGFAVGLSLGLGLLTRSD